MKKLLVIGLVCVLAGTANAAVLGIRTADGNLHGEADPLNLVISESAEIQITLDLVVSTVGGVGYPYEPYIEKCFGANIFMDSVEMSPNPEGTFDFVTPFFEPIADPTMGHENMEIIDVTRAGDVDFLWTTRAYDVDPMGVLEDAAVSPGSGISWEGYYLVANMNGDPPLTSPDTYPPDWNRYVLDTIVIHCTEASVDTLWFENASTFQAPFSPTPRTPSIFKDATGAKYGISSALGNDSWGFLGFDNGFIQYTGAPKTDFAREGFWIVQTPEPASFALLALGGLALLRRRK